MIIAAGNVDLVVVGGSHLLASAGNLSLAGMPSQFYSDPSLVAYFADVSQFCRGRASVTKPESTSLCVLCSAGSKRPTDQCGFFPWFASVRCVARPNLHDLGLDAEECIHDVRIEMRPRTLADNR